VIIQFLQNNGASFKLIDADIIRESHEAAAALGVKKDKDGKFSVAAPGASAVTPPAPPLGEVAEEEVGEGGDDGGNAGGGEEERGN